MLTFTRLLWAPPTLKLNLFPISDMSLYTVSAVIGQKVISFLLSQILHIEN